MSVSDDITTDLLFNRPKPLTLQSLEFPFDAIDEEEAAAIERALNTALATGMNPLNVAPYLVDQMSPARAETIARTEMLGAYRDSAGRMYRANSDVVQKWMWSASGSGNTCAACIFMDGSTFDLDEGMNSHPSCRCAMLPITLPWSDILGPLGIDFSDIGETNILQGYMDGPEWFTIQPETVQREILGPSKFEAWQRGDIDSRDLIGHDPDTGAVYERSLKDLGLDFRDYLGKNATHQVEEEAAAEVEQVAAATERAVSAEAEQALADAQARVDALRDAYAAGEATRDEANAALWDLARAQAKVDAEAGGRGAAIFMRTYENPFAGMDELNARTEQMFGRVLTRDELGGLVGAPEGSQVEFYLSGDDGLHIHMWGPKTDPMDPLQYHVAPDYHAERYLLPTRGGYYMSNTNFLISDELAGQGLGARIFTDEVDQLSQLGVRYIETNATGQGSGVIGEISREMNNGYYTWPRFGYVGHLPEYSRDVLREAAAAGDVPESWTRYTTIQQLMRTPEGRAWWQAFGSDIDGMRFDLRPDSYSMRLLTAYREEKAAAAAEQARVAMETERALVDAQTRLEQVVRSGASREDIKAAQWDVANRQAAVDVENGGRGYKIIVRGDDPLDTSKFDQTMQDLLGRDLTRDEIGGLAGAPDGAFIEVYTPPNMLVLNIEGPGYDPMNPLGHDAEFYATRYVARDADGNLMVRNVNFAVREDMRGQGLGARIFADQVQGLSGTDARYIEAEAAGAGAHPGGPNGYYTWPRFGFVGPLSQEARDIIQQAIVNGEVPDAWGSFTTIQELMQASGGPEWWKANGVPLRLRFDLSDGSYSRQVLENYLQQRGLGDG